MAVSGLVAMSVSWNDVMPIEFLGVLPLPEPLIATWLWPGVALALVNGAPNIVALAFMPNGISAFYLALGVLQTAASWHALRTGEDIA